MTVSSAPGTILAKSAQEAGVQEGDLIVGLGGEAIAGVDDLHRLLIGHEAVRDTVIDVIRRTERLELPIRPRARE